MFETDGLIILALLTILLAVGVVKLRKKVHVPWATSAIVIVFVFIVLFFWVNTWG